MFQVRRQRHDLGRRPSASGWNRASHTLLDFHGGRQLKVGELMSSMRTVAIWLFGIIGFCVLGGYFGGGILVAERVWNVPHLGASWAALGVVFLCTSLSLWFSSR